MLWIVGVVGDVDDVVSDIDNDVDKVCVVDDVCVVDYVDGEVFVDDAGDMKLNEGRWCGR